MTAEPATSSSATDRLLLARIVLVGGATLGVLVVFWALYWTYYWSPSALMVPAQRLPFWSWSIETALGGLFCVLGAYLLVRAEQVVGVTYIAAYIVAQGLAIGYNDGATAIMLAPDDWKRPVAGILINWFASATAIRAVQTFPSRLDAATVRLVGARSSLPAAVWRPVEWLLDPYRVWSFTAVLILVVWVIPSGLAWQVGQLVVIVLAVGTLAANYAAGGKTVRQRIYWFFLGAELLLAARLLSAISYVAIQWFGVGHGLADPRGLFQYMPLSWVVEQFLWTGAILGLMVCLVMGIFYRGAIDPRLAVRRTAVASVGTGVLVFAFAAFEEFLAQAVSDALDLDHLIVTAAAGVLVARAIRPLHDILTRLMERWLPRTDVVPTMPEVKSTES